MEGIKRNILELTKTLIEMRGDCGERANCSAEYVFQYLKDHGLKPEILENQGHKMISCRVERGERCLILNGHLDVVAGREEQYKIRIEEDRLYGRGSYDMLGSCAVMICFACWYARYGEGASLWLTLSTTEETQGEICTGYLTDHGVTGEFAICGEPTNLQISVMSKGVLRLSGIMHGKAAHSSRPWLGDNALIRIYRFYEKILKLPFANRRNAYFNGASINLSKVCGGVVMNQVPERAEFVIDIRYLPGDDPEAITKEICTLDSQVELTSCSVLPAVEVMEDNCWLNVLKKSVTAALGEPCHLMAQHGAADTVFFQNHGIPSVEFGLCGAGHHGPEEYVEISSMARFFQCLKEMAERMERWDEAGSDIGKQQNN